MGEIFLVDKLLGSCRLATGSQYRIEEDIPYIVQAM